MPISPVEALMREYGIPLTRDNYIEVNHLGKKTKVGPEEEAEMPMRFRYPVVDHTELPEVKKKEGKKGAPADFAGPVFRNPKNLKPLLDTWNPKPKRPTRGLVNMDTQNPTGKPPVMPIPTGTENPPEQEDIPGILAREPKVPMRRYPDTLEHSGASVDQPREQ